MAKDSKLVYGASGKTNVLTFEPEKAPGYRQNAPALRMSPPAYQRGNGAEHHGAGRS
jgi:hypothetical protein